MGERKHTPGPYHVSGTDEGPGKRFLHIGAASSVTVLASLNPHHPDALANAHLFAAAPDMLEALRRAEATFELMAVNAYQCGLEGTKDWDDVAGGADMHGSLDLIRAAIAKAESQS